MSLDFPAAGQAAWAIADATGILPEYLWPSLWLESNYQPSIMNAYGCVGLNQLCPVAYGYLGGVSPASYRTWSASAQLAGPVKAYLADQVARYGPVRSATKMQLAQLAPALLPTATLSTVIWTARDGAYGRNIGLDHGRKGYITVEDLAVAMRATVATSAVQSAITQTYALRPGASPNPDPVLGDDFARRRSALDVAVVSAGALLAAVALALAARATYVRLAG